MNILILNGSPKGKYSITLQTGLYLELMRPAHTFQVLHVGAQIKALEKDPTPALEAIARADLLIFSYPVYTFLAPSQLHSFFALLKGANASLAGKFATQITTSKHFYDVTAHRYVQDNCQDLGLRFIPGLSADMEDLTSEKGRQEALAFFDHALWCVAQAHFVPLPDPAPAPVHLPVTVPDPLPGEKTGDVVIVADCREDDLQLKSMIARFQAVLPRKSRVVNLRTYPFRGGCLGCFRCAVSGKCVYTDGFDAFLRENIQTAQAIVYAFSIQDHSMGPLFKLYDDRQFCNGHRTVTMGMPMGYLVSGDYSREPNLQTVIEGRAQVGGNYLAGVATDERDPDAAIDAMASELHYALDRGYVPPRNFYGVGGMKIFRDLIYQMRGMMRADHKFYKAHGQYDFPQKHWPQSLGMYFVGAMLSSPKLLSKMGNRMNEGMLAPYQKVLSQAKKEKEASKA